MLELSILLVIKGVGDTHIATYGSMGVKAIHSNVSRKLEQHCQKAIHDAKGSKMGIQPY